MPYDQTKRDRLEAYPRKGTRAALKRVLRQQGYKTLTAYLNAILEQEARTPRTNNEDGD